MQLHIVVGTQMATNRKRKPPVDIHVGRRIRMRRDGLSIPQEELAASLNISPAKLQQYEVDGKRVEPSRLFEIARLLKVPVFYFFSEIGDTEAETMSNKITANAEQLTSILRS